MKKTYTPQLEGQPEKNILSLVKEVFTDSTLLYWGHGTPVQTNAQLILQQGLDLPKGNIYEHAYPLSGISQEEIAQMLQQWPHYKLPFIVIIAIPMGVHPNTIISVKNEPQRYHNSPEVFDVIPPEYIKGYFNVKETQFVSNPQFNPPKKPIEATPPSEGQVTGPQRRFHRLKPPIGPKPTTSDRKVDDVW